MSNPIVLAIPAFFILIGVEILVGWRRRRTDYRFNDAVTSLNLGVGSQVVDALQVGASVAVYAWLYDLTAQIDMPGNAVWVWVVAFVVQDFLYYWFHRLSHEVGFLWAAHVVHHQSEAFNLSTALRQSWIQSMFSSVFYLPMAVLGVPPLVYATVRALNTLYQFWIHTEHIGRLGPFEWLFNTPSHHRVHHGVDDQYIDRNHAGLFIIWDKMFGTFEPEGDHPRYGTVKPLATFNPWWANLVYWAEMVRRARVTPRLRDKIAVFFREPGWLPPGAPPPSPDTLRTAPDYALYDPALPRAVAAYVLVHFIAIVAGAVIFLGAAAEMPVGPRLLAGGALLGSLATLGALLDRRAWARPAETVRLALLAAAGIVLLALDTAPLLGLLLLALGVPSALAGLRLLRARPADATLTGSA